MKNLKFIFITIVTLLVPLFMHAEVVEINATNFPDENFRNYLIESFGKGGTTLETNDVTKIDAVGKGISCLEGIEKFPVLQVLYCGSNNLQTIDASRNSYLADLKCEKNQLTSINLTGCGNLKVLNCEFNNLTALDLSSCKKLEFCVCDDNRITSLDVHGLTSLWYFMCFNNRLTSINVTGCTALKDLSCGFNTDGDKLPADGERNELTTIDVSTCTALENFYCNGNNLETLNVSNLTNLKKLVCAQIKSLTSINLAGCTALEYLNCRECSLPALNVDDCVSLKELYCYENKLTALDVSHCTKLWRLNAFNNDLPSLDMSNCPDLYELECYSNKRLSSLNLTGCKKLEILWAHGCNLPEIDLSDNPLLKTLSLHSNNLNELDLSKNTKITTFYCQNNHLIQLYLDEAADKSPKMGTIYLNPQTRNLTGDYYFDRMQKKYRFRIKMPSDPTGATENFVDDQSVNHYISNIATAGVEKQTGTEDGARVTYFVCDAPKSTITYNYFTNSDKGSLMTVKLSITYEQLTTKNNSKFDEKENRNLYKNNLTHLKKLGGEVRKLYRIVHGSTPSEDRETYLGEFVFDEKTYTFTKSDAFDADQTYRYDDSGNNFKGNYTTTVNLSDFFNEVVQDAMVESYEYEVRNLEGVILGGVVVPIYSGKISADVLSADGKVGYTRDEIVSDTKHELKPQNTLRVNVSHGEIANLSAVKVYNNHSEAGSISASDKNFDITDMGLVNDLCAALVVGGNTYGTTRTTVCTPKLTASVQAKERSSYSFTVNGVRNGYYYSATLNGTLALAEAQTGEYELVGMRAWRTVEGAAEYYQEIAFRSEDYNFFDYMPLLGISNNTVEGMGSANMKFTLNNGQEISWPSAVFGANAANPQANYIVRAYYRKAQNADQPVSGSDNAEDEYYISEDELVVDFGNLLPTSVEDVALGQVKHVSYVNLAGVESETPFSGVNIVVTTYTDGTTSTTKQMMK